MTLAYTTELTLEQDELLYSLLPKAAATGRPRTVNLMLVIQGILDLLVSGCAWRLLPKQYPPYSTVYSYFRQWRNDGTWKRVHDHLVEWVRVMENRGRLCAFGYGSFWLDFRGGFTSSWQSGFCSFT
jgi:putative transposase